MEWISGVYFNNMKGLVVFVAVAFVVCVNGVGLCL
jgi:hypothetical protein